MRFILKYKHATNLLGLDSGLAAVSSVVVTEGSIVDRITVVVSHEWLYRKKTVRQFVNKEAFYCSGSFF